MLPPLLRRLIPQQPRSHFLLSLNEHGPWLRPIEERLQVSGVELRLYFNGFLLLDKTATDTAKD